LPVYVWAIAVAGGIVAGIYLRHRSAQGASAAGDTSGTDAEGNDTSGQNTDATDLPDFGGTTGGSAGFNEAPPPDWSVGPNANGHLDPAFAKLLRQQINKDVQRAEKNEDRNKKHKKHKKAPARPGGTRLYPGGNPNGPPRITTTHMP
jgi:hypothetical protein